MDGRKRRTGATRSPHDDGGQHQRRYPDPARLSSRLPPDKVVIRGASEEITEEEVAQDLGPLPRPRSGQPRVPARILRKDGSWSRTPCHSTGLRPADEKRGSQEDFFGDAYMQDERHRRIEIGEEGPTHTAPPLPALRARTAELPRGLGLRQVSRTASDGGVHDAEERAGQVRPHTAIYRGCPKSPYNNRREAPAPTPRPVAPKPAPRPAPKKPETRKPQP
ncbi:hypothetical protein Trydic_g7680 [Trypoxylus dichotomus]